MTVLHPEVPEETLPVELDRIAGFITTAGGAVLESLRDSPWGRRRLAYPIRSGGRDVRDGYYTVWHFELGPDRVDDLERELRLDDVVIRHLIVNWEQKPPDEKAIEAAEIAAEDAAAAAYAAAQAAALAAQAETAEAMTAEAMTAEAMTAEAAGVEVAIAPVETASTEVAVVPSAETLAVEPVAAEAAREALVAEPATTEPAAAEVASAESAAPEPPAEVAPVETEATAERQGLTAAGTETETAPAAAEQSTVPQGAVAGDGTAECPDDYPVKGNASSRLYHTPASPSYKRTVPEFCFASADAAEAAGFSPTKYEAAQAESD
jgi:ribosomal protein S6